MTTYEKLERARLNLRALDRKKNTARRARRKAYWVRRFNTYLR